MRNHFLWRLPLATAIANVTETQPSVIRRLIFLLVICSGVVPSDTAGAAPVTQLKVMSFNVWVQGGLSLSNCIEVIRTTGADIVGLQECNATTAQTIASRLGYFVQPDGDSSIVSRYPILASIPSSGGRGATIELGPGQRAHLFNCHLTAYPYGPYDLKAGRSTSFIINQENTTRMPALTNLLNAMAPFIATGEACFLTGDFNAPSHLDYTSFPWPTSIAPLNAGLGDSYYELHTGNRKFPVPFTFNEPGITWTPKTSQEPEGVFDRIDFVYYSLGDGTSPIDSMELDERNSINPWPSDHRAVLTTFTLTPPMLLDKASGPVPQNGAEGVPTSTQLSWLPGGNATSHAVYFGAANPPPFLANTTNASLAVSNLLTRTAYYWRVDESTTAGTIAGDVWTFTTRSTNTATYEWTFGKGDLSPALGSGVLSYSDATTAGLTIFGTSDGIAVPHMGGQPSTYLRAPGFTAPSNGYHVTFTETGPNGGGIYINQFTMIFDVLIPAPLNWCALFNTNPGNANDADFYVSPTGQVGIGAIGYSAGGVVTAGQWYRIAFVADLAAASARYYVNGVSVFSGSAGTSLDGRHSLYSNEDAGPDILLFNEGEGAAIYTHEILLGSFAFTGRALSSEEMQALGGPRAEGIFVRHLSIQRSGTTVVLQWTGAPNVRLQKTTSLNSGAWQDVSGTLGASQFTESVAAASVFYRTSGP